MSPGPWLIFDYISLGLGRDNLSFKLINLPNSSQGVLGPPPIPFLSWIFQGFVPLSHPVFSPNFPRLDSFPLCHHCDSYCTCLKALLCHLASTALVLTSPCTILVSTVHVLSKEISPTVYSPASCKSAPGQLFLERLENQFFLLAQRLSPFGGCSYSMGILWICPFLVDKAECLVPFVSFHC